MHSSTAMQNINPARLDLASIRLVVLCAEMGSLSKASRHSHCTLSAGSQRLSAFEKALGMRLFERDPRGLRITEAGQLVALHGKAILRQLELMKVQMDGRLAEASNALKPVHA